MANMETGALLRTALLRNVLSSLEQPLDPRRTAAISEQLVGNGLLTAGPDAIQGGNWAPVTELQGKLVEQLLKHLTKAEAAFRPGAAVLLGLVCSHVSPRAFLSSYSEWAAALLEVVRKDSGAAPRAAGLRALADLFSRIRELLEVPGVRRDASGIAGRTLQVATPLLTDADCQASALAAVHSVLQALPTVARNHTGPLERSLAGVMAAPASPSAVRAAAAAALALLPRAVADDAAAWSALIRRVLLSLHTAIDLLMYHGGGGGAASQDGGLGQRAREQLEAVGPGVADAEGLLGPVGFTSGAGPAAAAAAGAAAAGGRPDVTLTVQVTSALLELLVRLVGRGSTSPVPVPAHAILLLVMRVVRMDAAVLLAPGRAAPSASAQCEVLALLPDLHVSGWELLGLTARVVRGGLMPLTALVGRLLAEHLRRIKAGGAGGLAVSMPAPVRASLYRSTTAVLRVGGFAAGRYMSAEIAGTLITELYGLSATQQQERSKAPLYGGGAAAAGTGLGKGARTGGLLPGAAPPAKKAKTSAADPLAAFDVATAAVAAAALAPVASPADVDAQRAALELAEALLQVYGPALPSDLRGQLDALSYHMAAVLGEASYRAARSPGAAAAAHAADLAALRVAATRSLVASLAAPWPTRHPFLSEGLQLLSTGASGAGGAALAAVCSEGLLALEALLRPRSVPHAWTARMGGGGIGAGGGAAAGDAGQLPRPRLWSMLEPVAPQLPPPAAAVTATGPDVVAPPSNGTAPSSSVPAATAQQPAAAAAPDASPAVARGDAMEVCGGGSGGSGAQEAAAAAEAVPSAAAGSKKQPLTASKGKDKGKKDKGKTDKTGKEKGPPAAQTTPAAATPAATAAQQGKKALVPASATGKRAAADAMGADDGQIAPGTGAAAKGLSTPAAAQAVAPGAAAAAAAAPAAAQPAGAAQTPRPAPAMAAAAAPVFGDESEDSEGALPEIDSGNDDSDGDE